MLLVYNRADPDSAAIRDHYLQLHPGVHDLNLANLDLVGRHTITASVYARWIRAPIRKHLATHPDLKERIVCIALTLGIPHRIEDASHPESGDDAALMRREWLDRGDFTAASVDSELTLLWQDLERNEFGGKFDSKADGFIANPCFGAERPASEYDRRFCGAPKQFTQIVKAGADLDSPQAGWAAAEARLPAARLSPGDIYLVVRLDGPSRRDVLVLINRSRKIEIRKSEVAIVMDADAWRDFDKGDYDDAEKRLQKNGWRVTHDRTANFLTSDEMTTPVIAYAGYGLNAAGDSPGSTDYIRELHFAPGAIFNTLESFNGRDFGGAGDRRERPQTQVADFIAAGGTFGIGNVWEPFSFSAASNAELLDAMLIRGWSFAESAYGSLRALSWQQIVVGDPLARITVLP